MSHYAFCGLSRKHPGELVTELAPRWEARCESGRRQRRRGDRRRLAGAGPKYALVFTGRLLVTLVHLRTGLTHEALGVTCQAGSSTIGCSCKPKNPGEGAIIGQHGWRQAKRRQSSQRIAAGHANAELRQWRPVQRWTGRRQDYAETHCAIAGLVSDRAAERAAGHRPNTELVPAFPIDGPGGLN
jgi:hypothetical protein